ncbi:EAL domain-containing protein [Mariprofundus ferrooxydans]|uniref:EAL domain-containing response regulator n=1 Tax=Mariprofundus ferrooxydans TaxID=314344 RepID=UPI000361F746|nr:EAL domain-containing response regulator [Mariprofundus ferrooxydans]
MKSIVSNQSVLVVDDEPFVLETTAFILRRLGFKAIFTAENVHDALAILESSDTPIELVLSDLNMPDVDGVELLRLFAERAYEGDIVLFSGEDSRTLSMAESLAKARNLSVLGSVSKPLKVDELTVLLAKRGKVLRKNGHVTPDLVPVDELVAAIEAEELEPWYQPKIDIASKRVVGVEALVRWPSKEKGMVFPDAFIPVAEENGLIDALTFLVIKKAADMQAHWQKQGLSLKIAINVSMDSLYDLTFPERVVSYLEKHRVDPTGFQLEVTESRLMDDLVGPLDILLRLRLKRFSLSIDDFGTGHSNLTQLRDLPFDEIKLDRSFVQGAAEDERAKSLLESSVDIAKKLDMEIVSEGVETLEDWQRVEMLGCDQVQGYFVSRPLPGDDIPAWVENWPKLCKTLFP